MAKTSEELLAERTKRIIDAIELRVPDRVPIFLTLHQFPAKYAGLTLGEAWYNLDKWIAAYEKAIVDFEPDLYMPPEDGVFTGGAVHEILDNRQIKWPGHNLPPTVSFQFVEGEYIKAEEYAAFLQDPSDFVVRQYLPRIFGALEGLSLLPPLTALTMGYAGAAMVGVLAVPPVAKAFEALASAAAEAARWTGAYAAFRQKMTAMGFPAWNAGVAVPPFDIISDFLRGMRGAMLDMYRHPDELLAVQEKVLPMLVQSAVAACAMSGNPRVFIALHRGADGFMSLEQFETFYWPGFKSLVLALIDAGLTPCPFFEGVYDQRLEYLRELPKGKIMGLFDRTNLAKAKEVIGDTMCIAAGMSVSLLQTGTPEQIVEHTRKVIDTVGKGGGFIMTTNTVLDDARPELVKVWVDATKKYGVY
jgi:hypothetical protein